MQSDLAKQLGVHRCSIQNWERNIGTPIPAQMPAIIRFLGYVPFGHDGSPGGKTRWFRVCAGWTQDELAEAAGCESVTVWRWETNQPFDHKRWHSGLAVLRERLRSIGLAELTDDYIITTSAPPPVS